MPFGPDCFRTRGAVDRRRTLNRISKYNDLTTGGYKMTKLTSIVCAECTKQATKNHQDTSDHNWNFAAPSISDEWPNSSQRACILFSARKLTQKGNWQDYQSGKLHSSIPAWRHWVRRSTLAMYPNSERC